MNMLHARECELCCWEDRAPGDTACAGCRRWLDRQAGLTSTERARDQRVRDDYANDAEHCV